MRRNRNGQNVFDCRAWLTLKIKKLDVIPRPLNNEQVVIKVRQHSYQWHSVPVIRHFGQRRLPIKQALFTVEEMEIGEDNEANFKN